MEAHIACCLLPWIPAGSWGRRLFPREGLWLSPPPGDPQDRHCRGKHLVGGTPGVFWGQHVGGYFNKHSLKASFLPGVLLVARGWRFLCGGWGLLGASAPPLWVPGVLAGELGLLWACFFGNSYLLCLCVLSFMPSSKRWSNAVGSPLGKQDPTQLDGVMGHQPQNSPLVLALREGSRPWHQHRCWGMTGSRLGCRNPTWAACPDLCPFLPHARPSSEAVQTRSTRGRRQAQPEHAARSLGV